MCEALGMTEQLTELCRKVAAARASKAELKAKIDKVNDELGELEASLATLIATEVGTGKGKNVNHDGMVFSSSVKVAWKIEKDGKDKLIVLLKEGAPELVKESVNASTLAAYLRKNESKLEKAVPDWWESAKKLLNREETPTLSVRKGK